MKIVQTIHIGTFSINTVGGSSIIQIGSSGMIQAHSESYETTEAAPVRPEVPPAAVPPAAAPVPANAVKVEVPGVLNGQPFMPPAT